MTTATNGTTSAVPLVRWFISSATLTVPQAAGPVAFALVALAVTGDTSGGAGMILAMTLAQVAGAIPITRAGRSLPSATFLRLLVIFRTVALGAVALLAHYSAPFIWLVAFSALAGSVNGAAFGYLRTVLNQLAPPEKLPRALGIAATLNEVTFVLAPVAASGLATLSPVWTILAIAALGAIPALLVPTVMSAPIDEVHRADASVISPAILLWLMCAAAGSSTVAALEIGAVALALHFGYAPALAILFPMKPSRGPERNDRLPAARGGRSRRGRAGARRQCRRCRHRLRLHAGRGRPADVGHRRLRLDAALHARAAASIEIVEFYAKASLSATARHVARQSCTGQSRDGFAFLLEGGISEFGHLAVCTPGSVKGYDYALSRFGTMDWADVIAPAIAQARSGVLVRPHMHWFWSQDQKGGGQVNTGDKLRYSETGRDLYFRPDGSLKRVGDLLDQSRHGQYAGAPGQGRCRPLLPRRALPNRSPRISRIMAG
jgi:hypothetical protein